MSIKQLKCFLNIFFKLLKYDGVYCQFIINVKKHNQIFRNFIDTHSFLKSDDFIMQYTAFLYHKRSGDFYSDVYDSLNYIKCTTTSFPWCRVNEGYEFWEEKFGNYFDILNKYDDVIINYINNV